MKKLSLFFAVLLSAAAFSNAQPGPSITTPTPGPLAAVSSETMTMYHWTIDLQAIQSFAAATGDITLFTGVAGQPMLVKDIIIRPTTPVTGGSISAVTAQVQGASGYGSAKDVHTASGISITNATSTLEATAQVIKLHLASTGGNLSTATAGTIDVWIQRTEMR